MLRNNRWVGRYYVDVLGQSKRVRKAIVLGMKNELTKPEARRKLLEVIAEEGVNTPEHLERSVKPLTTFNEIADAWEERRLPQLKISTQCTAPKQISRHLRPFFGSRALETIKTGTINEWISQLSRSGLKPKSVHNLYKQFRAITNWNSQQNDEPKRSFYPSLPVIPDADQRWFTQKEMHLLIGAAKGQYKALFHLAAFSGLRSGELSGLHVEDLDLDRGVLRVRRSAWRGQEVSPKTKRGYRDVRIDSVTIRMLKDYLDGRTTGRVFQTRNGTPFDNHGVVRAVLKPLCEKLGIPSGGMHAFRHGRVSHLQASNVPSDFTKNQVGHSNLRTTSGYTHFSEAFERDTIERVGPSWTHSANLDSAAMAAKSG